MITDIQTIPLNKLFHSEANVRRTGKAEGIEGLVRMPNPAGATPRRVFGVQKVCAPLACFRLPPRSY